MIYEIETVTCQETSIDIAQEPKYIKAEKAYIISSEGNGVSFDATLVIS